METEPNNQQYCVLNFLRDCDQPPENTSRPRQEEVPGRPHSISDSSLVEFEVQNGLIVQPSASVRMQRLKDDTGGRSGCKG